MLKVFQDAEGAPSMQQIVDIAKEIPEAIKSLPADKAAEVMKLLQQMIGAANPEGEGEEESTPTETVETMDADPAAKKEEIPVEDAAKFEDSKKFKDAVMVASDSAVKNHSAVIEKAIKFVDDQYSFADKSTKQVMLDALAVEHGDIKFEDAELAMAFKLLKKSESTLMNFGDSKETSALEARIKAEFGE